MKRGHWRAMAGLAWGLAGVAGPGGLAGQVAGGATAMPPPAVVTTETNLKELAQGYAAAFLATRDRPVSITLKRAGETYVIPDVATLRAVESVLLVTTGRGPFYIINPGDILWISNRPSEG